MNCVMSRMTASVSSSSPGSAISWQSAVSGFAWTWRRHHCTRSVSGRWKTRSNAPRKCGSNLCSIARRLIRRSLSLGPRPLMSALDLLDADATTTETRIRGRHVTPQSSFFVVADIVPERMSELRELLARMNVAPGRVDANNELVPFARLDRLHFARFSILDDPSIDDIEVYRLPPVRYPLTLALLGDCDGPTDACLAELATHAGPGLRRLFACCGLQPSED